MTSNDYFYQKSKYYYEMFKQNKLVKKVCAFIKSGDKFLVLVKDNIAYNIGGSVDKDEKTKDAVIREIFEESGGVVKDCKYLTKRYYSVKWNFEDKDFENRRVEFFYLCAIKDESLCINGLDGEFDKSFSLQWHTLEELEKLKLNKNEIKIMREKI